MILIYGAYGYTGRLIVDESLKHGLKITLAGRNEQKLKRLALEKNLPHVAFSLRDDFDQHLKNITLVIHCAGPFEFTAEPMVKACIRNNVHYLDITGEYTVFEHLKTYDQEAKAKGIMLLPGAGFDVVPSDCLAAQLHQLLPEGQDLELAFTSKGAGLSRGTAKTMIENINRGHAYRKENELVHAPLGTKTKTVDYGEFKQLSMGISWGDISTAFTSTSIPNIIVYTGSSAKQINKARWAHRLRFILSASWVKNILKRQIDKKPAGPSDRRRSNSSTYLYGSISDGRRMEELRIKTPNGYTLTARTAVDIANRCHNGDFKAGYQTPSSAYGANYIYKFDGVEKL